MRAFAVGLTGGIASGKTLVADAFAALRVPVIDADHVAREIVAPGSAALAKIVDYFGASALLPDGGLNRRWMREVVFRNPEARQKLEAITHPRIRAQLRAWRDAQRDPYCMLVIPLLLEGKDDGLVDRVLVVDATEETQHRRLTARDRISDTLARDIMATQLTRQGRLALADDVIDNTGAPEEIRTQVAGLHRLYLDLASQQPRR